MDVVVKSIEAIKPSSPTPSHFRRHYRSFIDQTNPKTFMPTIYYYYPPANNMINSDPIAANAGRIDILKRSLADVLTSFYPFAGRAIDPSFIDCDDSGVVFTESVVMDRCITDVIAEKNAEQLNLLLPFSMEITDGVHEDERLLGVQANIFKCGGLALGVSWSHNICDAFCLVNFINSWASLARGGEEITHPPTTISASIFPPVDNLPMFGKNNNNSDINNDIDETNKNIANEENNKKNEGKKVVVTKVFRFSGASISSLKDKYSEPPELIPTSVEALSTFIWTRFYESKKKQQSSRYVITQTVNLRNKADPGLKLDSCIGNVCQFVVVHPDLDLVDGSSGYGIVRRMRAAIRKFDGEYVKKLQKGDASLFFEGFMDSFIEGTSMFMFSSMNRFPYYDADFGWGRPIWVSYGHFDFSNMAAIFPTESGDGSVEVWLTMKEDDMKDLQLDQQFLNVIF